MKPLGIDLYAGLGGWTEGLLAEGYDVVGFDNEQHVYGEHRYPAQLVIQDVLTLHGRQFKDAALIVASPPCQGYSYRAMPWKRAKALPPPDNSLFEACFRIHAEANLANSCLPNRDCSDCDGTGNVYRHDEDGDFLKCDTCARTGRAARYIPLVVENVCGAQKWVGRARWHYGSFYLWGDVPALMPMTKKAIKVGGLDWTKHGQVGYAQGPGPAFNDTAIKGTGGSWFNVAHNKGSGVGRNPDGRNDPRDDQKYGGDWLSKGSVNQIGRGRQGSFKRRYASAMIAKIPLSLSRHIAKTYYPHGALP